MSLSSVRSGIKIRQGLRKIKQTEKKKYTCPECNKQKIRKKSVGVWLCLYCRTSYADNAYEFKNELYLFEM